MQDVQSFIFPGRVGVAKKLEQLVLDGNKIISFHVYEVESSSGMNPTYELLVVTEKVT
tara:strand:+ start:3279 stop:3452 length:174 start_codon:yes stop_codon:yes gene_type:complete